MRLGEMEVSNYSVLLVVMDEGRRERGRKGGREGGREGEGKEGGREGRRERERDRKTQRDTCMGIVYICVYVYNTCTYVSLPEATVSEYLESLEEKSGQISFSLHYQLEFVSYVHYTYIHVHVAASDSV